MKFLQRFLSEFFPGFLALSSLVFLLEALPEFFKELLPEFLPEFDTEFLYLDSAAVFPDVHREILRGFFSEIFPGAFLGYVIEIAPVLIK